MRRKRTNVVFGLRDGDDRALESIGDPKKDATEGVVLFDEARARFLEVGEGDVGDSGRLRRNARRRKAKEGRSALTSPSGKKELRSHSPQQL